MSSNSARIPSWSAAESRRTTLAGAFPVMVGKRGGSVIQHVLRKLLVELVRDDVKAMVSLSGADPVPTEAVVQFLASGLFGLLIWWLNGRMRLSVEEVNGIFRRLAVPALKAVLR